MTRASIAAKNRKTPPHWAVRQRDLIALMDRAAHPFVDHSTRPDGTLIQRTEWTSMDGTDNGYEAFLSFPLFYLLGGGEHIYQIACKEWDAITWQYANYGTVEREFVTGFDWFHHSESYTYIYYLALADPAHLINRTRALRYAAMYTGADPLAPNWDAQRKMIRSPLNGSKGPRFVTTQVDWDYHRPILADYLAPFEDILGADGSDPLFKVDWTDDEVFARVLDLINQRMTRCDVPLNLERRQLDHQRLSLHWRRPIQDLGARLFAGVGGALRGQRRHYARQYWTRGNHWRVDGRQVVGWVLRLALAARRAQYRRAGPSGRQLCPADDRR